MSSETFNALLLDISNQLKEDDLTKLKFLLGDRIGKRDLERISSGHDLFQAMRERELLGPEKRDLLNNLLKNIPRPDLSKKLQQDPAPIRGPSEEETAKLVIASRVISENLGRSWRKLGRRLGMSESKLESISKRHPTELEETAMELLKEWTKSREAEARTEDLVKALRDCQFNLTADKVEDKLRAEGY
ncbi:protein FADD [Oryzias melastigma]|uniref:Fas (tnfrsf6)-associated via death domain n=1 Tax=Oryzias melastigma TaxID=30732 RepID=A0A3B3BA65_ORYME|nr:protein FADD [Oryzias melastigma]